MRRFTVTTSVLAFLAAAALLATSETQTRTIYFNAVDKKGSPVADLKAADIVVKEGGKIQTPLSFARATTPMQIAVIVDNPGRDIPEVRESVATLAEAVRGQAEIGIFSTRLPNSTVVDFTRDSQALTAAIQTLMNSDMGMSSSGNVDAVTEHLAQRFEAKNTARPAFIAVTIHEPCTLAGQMGPATPPQPCSVGLGSVPLSVVDEVQRSRATFFAIEARQTAPGDHNPLFDAAAQATGGSVERALTDSAIPTAFKKITDNLLGQYVVTYNVPEAPKDGARLRVEVNRPGVVARAPERVGVR